MRIRWALLALCAACGGTSPQGRDGGSDAGSGDGGFLSDGGLASYCDSAGGGGCADPYACLSIGGGTGGFCTEGCTPDGGACPSNGVCQDFSGDTYCVAACASSGSCPAGDVCEPLTASAGVCVPDCRTHADMCGGTVVSCNASLGYCTFVGPQTFGEPCQGNDAGACAGSLSCVILSTAATQGFCTQACAPDAGAACPGSPAGAACDVTSQTGTSYCGWPCAGAEAGCPPGLSCQPTSAGSFFCQ